MAISSRSTGTRTVPGSGSTSIRPARRAGGSGTASATSSRIPRLGDARTISLDLAREQANAIRLAVALGKDPRAAERKTTEIIFGDLAARYVEEYARRHNKSWRQADALVRKHLLPRFGERPASEIARSDVRAVIAERIDTPGVANGVLAAASGIFSWALDQEIIAGVNPCAGVKSYPMKSCSRVPKDEELRRLWPHLDPAHKLLLLTGQRPVEIACMRAEDIADGVWHLKGKAEGTWPGVKNGEDNRVPLSGPAQTLIEPHLAGKVGPKSSARRLRKIVAELGIPRVIPHDFRRSCLTMIVRLGHGRDALDRIANHRKRSVTTVYDCYEYTDEDKKIMEDVAALIMSIVE